MGPCPQQVAASAAKAAIYIKILQDRRDVFVYRRVPLEWQLWKPGSRSSPRRKLLLGTQGDKIGSEVMENWYSQVL